MPRCAAPRSSIRRPTGSSPTTIRRSPITCWAGSASCSAIRSMSGARSRSSRRSPSARPRPALCANSAARVPARCIAGFWFVATLARFFEFYVGMNEPQLFGLAVMSAGFAWFWKRHAEGRAVEPAVLVMVLAGFIKHNFIALPLVALLWLWLDNWRLGLRATLDRRGRIRARACDLRLHVRALLHSRHAVSAHLSFGARAFDDRTAAIHPAGDGVVGDLGLARARAAKAGALHRTADRHRAAALSSAEIRRGRGRERAVRADLRNRGRHRPRLRRVVARSAAQRLVAANHQRGRARHPDRAASDLEPARIRLRAVQPAISRAGRRARRDHPRRGGAHRGDPGAGRVFKSCCVPDGRQTVRVRSLLHHAAGRDRPHDLAAGRTACAPQGDRERRYRPARQHHVAVAAHGEHHPNSSNRSDGAEIL